MKTGDVEDLLAKAEQRNEEYGSRPFNLGDVTVAIYFLAAVLADIRDLMGQRGDDKG